MMTDEGGVARGPITTDGEWIFLVRHVDPSKKVEEGSDESIFASALAKKAR